jgi:hypothetical protein
VYCSRLCASFTKFQRGKREKNLNVYKEKGKLYRVSPQQQYNVVQPMKLLGILREGEGLLQIDNRKEERIRKHTRKGNLIGKKFVLIFKSV